MNRSIDHDCPDGLRFKVSLIQAVRDLSLSRGATFTFHVEPEHKGADPDAGQGGAAVFNVIVHFAPIFLIMASPQERQRIEARALKLVTSLLDNGQRQKAELQVASDGTVRLGPEVVERLCGSAAGG
ncbi:MAG: hypothetical protein ACE5HV_05060 [Acidobacteriota bacterium]